MAYVSVGQVENLEEAVRTIQSTYQVLENECQIMLRQVAEKLIECRAETTLSNSMLAEAITIETIKAAKFAEATVIHAQAEAEFATACAAANPAAVAIAAANVAETIAELKVAYDEYETAKSHRMQMERRVELTQQATLMAVQLEDSVKYMCSTSLNNVSSFIETGTTRIQQAKSTLDSYLSMNRSVAEFYSWIMWSPKNNVPVTPAELNSRLNMSVEQQLYFVEYLADRDQAFRSKIKDYRHELDAAQGPAERHAVQLKIRRHMSGLYGEKMVEFALKPLGQNVYSQSRTVFEDGRYTKTDLIIKGLKVPVILGRGEGMSAPVGGSIAIEVKCGRSDYIYSQKDHMLFQSGGHQDSSASITVCSRDIKDLPPEKAEELRTTLRKAGSPLIGMLPKKDEIDRVCWEAVLGGI